eukprot:RCo031220
MLKKLAKLFGLSKAEPSKSTSEQSRAMTYSETCPIPPPAPVKSAPERIRFVNDDPSLGSAPPGHRPPEDLTSPASSSETPPQSAPAFPTPLQSSTPLCAALPTRSSRSSSSQPHPTTASGSSSSSSSSGTVGSSSTSTGVT